jgi:hypothetical protein
MTPWMVVVVAILLYLGVAIALLLLLGLHGGPNYTRIRRP